MSFTLTAPAANPPSQSGLLGDSISGRFGLTMPLISLNPQGPNGGAVAGLGNLWAPGQSILPMNAHADGELTQEAGANSLANILPRQSFVFYPIPENQFAFYPESLPTQDHFDTEGNVILTENEDEKPKTRHVKVKSKKKASQRRFKMCC